jgi:hypothetical protein
LSHSSFPGFALGCLHVSLEPPPPSIDGASPGDERRQFGTHTRTDTFEVKGSIVPLETRKASLVLSATGSFSDTTERDFLGAIYNDHIRTVRVAADYQRQDDLGGRNYLTVGLRQGLDRLGAVATFTDQLSVSF